MSRVSLACLAFAWIAASPRATFAQTVALEWSAPDECADSGEMQDRVSQRLGESTSRAPLSASGRIERTPSGYTLTLRTPTGERQLEAASCDELVESAAVILALLIDPRAVHEPKEVEPEPEPEAEETEPEPTASPATNPEDRVLRGFVRAELIGDAGLLPRVGLGPGLAGGVTWYQTTFEFSANYFPAHDLRKDDGMGVGDLHAFAGSLGACQALLPKPELGPCLFVEYAWLSGRGTVPPVDNDSGGLWSLLIAARLSVALGSSFGWVLEFAMGLPTSVGEFKVQGEVVHKTGAVVGRARTGLEVRF
jgi:hypothetical protein